MSSSVKIRAAPDHPIAHLDCERSLPVERIGNAAVEGGPRNLRGLVLPPERLAVARLWVEAFRDCRPLSSEKPQMRTDRNRGSPRKRAFPGRLLRFPDRQEVAP